jgi:hypothetical protein
MRTNIFISILALLSGLSISLVAIYYSVSGLVSIFSGAATSIIIMGSTLEISKLVATVWLKRFWDITPKIIKAYLISAIIILMAITSLGIFGFLSRAAEEQNAATGYIEDKLLIIDDKIKIQEDIINSSKKSLEQLNIAVDQVMGRSASEKGAVKSVKIRQSQKEERIELQKNIHDAQDKITILKQERTPISIQSRKSAVEYGPIKHLAGLLFNDSSKNLDNAVRYVIILLVIVFDPLAIILLLCSQYSFSYISSIKKQVVHETINEESPEEPPIEDTHDDEEIIEEQIIEEPIAENKEELPQEIIDLDNSHKEPSNLVLDEKVAKTKWKEENKNDTIKHQEKLFNLGLIDKLPWENT